MELLKHPSELARQRACHALRLVGQGVGDRLIPAADALLARLEDASDAVRGEAAFALGLLGDRREATLERLVELARTGSASTRASALHAIGNISRRRAEEEPRCEGPPFAGTADDWIALAAAEALWKIERRAELVLPTFERLFDDGGEEEVCDVVCLMGPEGRPLLPKLLDALARGDNWDLQWAAADAIGHVASDDPETLQALKAALAHESGIVRSAAARALARIGAPAVPRLLDMFATEIDEKAQEWVAELAIVSINRPRS